jgi:hypothetical protein
VAACRAKHNQSEHTTLSKPSLRHCSSADKIYG